MRRMASASDRPEHPARQGCPQRALPAHGNARLQIAGPKPLLAGLLLQPTRAAELIQSPGVTVEGDRAVLDELVEIIDTFDQNFNLSTP